MTDDKCSDDGSCVILVDFADSFKGIHNSYTLPALWLADTGGGEL